METQTTIRTPYGESILSRDFSLAERFIDAGMRNYYWHCDKETGHTARRRNDDWLADDMTCTLDPRRGEVN